MGAGLERLERQSLIKAIFNKGFSGNSSILPRSNFGVGGQESRPQSLIALHIASTDGRKCERRNVNRIFEPGN